MKYHIDFTVRGRFEVEAATAEGAEEKFWDIAEHSPEDLDDFLLEEVDQARRPYEVAL